jgi:hypothetical protein
MLSVPGNVNKKPKRVAGHVGTAIALKTCMLSYQVRVLIGQANTLFGFVVFLRIVR